MAEQKILIPYNFTISESKALDFVLDTFAHREDVKITLFYAYTPLPEIDMKASPELRKIKSGIAFLAEEFKKKEDGLISAKRHLLQNGFLDDQVDYVFKKKEKSIAEEITDQVSKGHYRMLILSHQGGKVTRLFARSVHSRVLSVLRDVTVCIAT